jgi:hypothetical protein
MKMSILSRQPETVSEQHLQRVQHVFHEYLFRQPESVSRQHLQRVQHVFHEYLSEHGCLSNHSQVFFKKSPLFFPFISYTHVDGSLSSPNYFFHPVDCWCRVVVVLFLASDSLLFKVCFSSHNLFSCRSF